MNTSLVAAILVALTVATVASSERLFKRPGRIAAGAPATDQFHACMLLVWRDNIGQNQVALGGGSIVARNRVLTAAHVVNGANRVQAGFFSGRIQANRFRRVDASYWQPNRAFNGTLFLNDIAVIQFASDVFPAANVIPIAAVTPAIDVATRLASFGFTAPGSAVPSQIPQLSQQVVATCTAVLNTTDTHICGLAQGTSVVCPGDNGSGLYTETSAGTPVVVTRQLVGVVSMIQPGCAGAARLTAFTRLDGVIQNFLRSQGLTVV